MNKLFYLLKRFFEKEIVSATIGFVVFLFGAALVMLYLERPTHTEGFDSFFHSLWFSIVTVTTVGYGDMAPKSQMGQSAAMVIIIVGIAYSGVLTGYITTWLVERNRKRQLGLHPLKNLEGKFLVCGWKSDMTELLKDILRLHKKNSDYLILLNNVPPNELMELKQDPELQNLSYYQGDDTVVEHLEAACAATAEKVMVLADQRAGKTPEEIDFQTVLTAFAMDRINPRIYLITELVLPKFRDYLQHAKVEEVVLTRHNSMSMICNIALMSGVFGIYRKVFDTKTGIMETEPIAQEWVGKSWKEFKDHHEDKIVLGVLENVGNITQRKHEKMGQVQTSATIQRAILRLKNLQHMQSNQPVLHPGPDYIIHENSSVIFLNAKPYRLNHDIEEFGKHSLHHYTPVIFIARYLEGILRETQNWVHYTERLKIHAFEPYISNQKVVGIRHHGNYYPFDHIPIAEDLRQLLVSVFSAEMQPNDAHNSIAFANPSAYLTRKNAPKSIGEVSQEKIGPLYIIGWKDQLVEMIQYLLMQQKIQNSQDWSSIVVIAEINLQQEQKFQRRTKHNENVTLFNSDISLRGSLRSAGVAKASKVLILAETGKNKTFDEIDAQTVLTSMMVSELNKKAYIVAELMDKRYENTLRQARVEEVLSTDEFSRQLLALGAHGTGLTNVFKEMFNLTKTAFSLVDIPESYIGQPYKDIYQDHLTPGVMVLGLIEDAGNIYVRKEKMVKEAQFATSIVDSVSQLKSISELQANKVHISPNPELLLRPYSKLILLHSTDTTGWSRMKENHQDYQIEQARILEQV